MKKSTRQRKESTSHFQNLYGEDNFALKIAQTISWGKRSIDSLNHEIGKMLVESILLMDRENIAGPDHAPTGELYKWAHQQGSVFIGDQKVKVSRPRLRGPEGEVALPSYEKLKSRDQFSEEILTKLMSGLSGRRYHETVHEAAEAFGVSPSSASRHFVESKLFVPIFDDLIRGFEELNRELHEKHEQDMVFLPPFFNEYTLPEIRELLLESDKSAIEVYYDIFSNKENLDKLLVQWKKNEHFTEERMKILSDALDAHRDKKYTLAIPALMGQLEGLVLEAFGIEQGQISWAVKVGFPKKGRRRDYVSHIKGSYVMHDIFLSEIFNSSKKEGYAPKGIYPHRPTIQHGVNTSYYKNPHATTRLIMLIDFVSSEDFQEGAKQFRLKRTSSPQETPTV